MHAHVGIRGEELADEAANAARTGAPHLVLPTPQDTPAPAFGFKRTHDDSFVKPADVPATVQDATVGQRATKRPRSVPSTWRAIAADNSLDVNESQAYNRMRGLPAFLTRGIRYHRSNPWTKGKGHQCPLCSRTFWSSTHARLACQHEALRGMGTVAHNVAVARIADAIQASNRYHDFHMLVNAGKHSGYKCAAGRPAPRSLRITSTVDLILIEVKYTGDKNLKKRRAEAGDIYVPLMQRLHDAGYTVIGEGPSGLPPSPLQTTTTWTFPR